MAIIRNNRKLAAVARENQEDHPRHSESRKTVVVEIEEDYITEVSVEIEGKVTKKPSQEFNWT